MTDTEQFRNLAQVMKILANESRLKIVCYLSGNERTVGDLAVKLSINQSTLSKHLALLRAHGIVGDRREGNLVYYRLLTPCAINFFSCALQVIKERSFHVFRVE